MADIDKVLPNIEQNITVPSDVEIEEAELEKQQEVDEQGNPIEIQENEDGSVDINLKIITII
jgi:hypothetical protein